MHALALEVQIPASTEFHGLFDWQKLIGVTWLKSWLTMVSYQM